MALSIQQRKTLAFDFAIDNRLRLFFGMELDNRAGWAVNLTANLPWNAAAFRSEAGQNFVPFGRLEDETELDDLLAALRTRPAWFAQQLDLLRVPDDTIVLVNCPCRPGVLRDQVLNMADAVLLVSAPDSMSYVETHRIASLADEKQIAHVLTVLNGFDAARQLDRDIALLLRTRHRDVFSPVVIHRDEFLREAVACKQTIFEFAPSSQAASDYSALATWVLARLGQFQEDRT